MRDEQLYEEKVQYLRALFDAIPAPAFVVDEDVAIHDFNAAAEGLLGPEPVAVLLQRSGEAFHCIHAEVNGCGKAQPCEDCVIRNSVKRALGGRAVHREFHRAQLRRGRSISPIELLVTASLLPYTDPPQAVVVLESITELVRRRSPARGDLALHPGVPDRPLANK